MHNPIFNINIISVSVLSNLFDTPVAIFSTVWVWIGKFSRIFGVNGLAYPCTYLCLRNELLSCINHAMLLVMAFQGRISKSTLALRIHAKSYVKLAVCQTFC